MAEWEIDKRAYGRVRDDMIDTFRRGYTGDYKIPTDKITDEVGSVKHTGVDLTFDLPEGLEIDLSKLEREAVSMTGCSHEWKKYYGMAEAFDYCNKCDIKREMEK